MTDWTHCEEELFEIDLPSAWFVVSRRPDGIVARSAGMESSAVSVVVTRVPRPEASEITGVFSVQRAALAKTLSEYQELEQNEESGSDPPRQRLLASFAQGVFGMTMEQVHLALPEGILVGTAVAENEVFVAHADVIETILGSFKPAASSG